MKSEHAKVPAFLFYFVIFTFLPNPAFANFFLYDLTLDEGTFIFALDLIPLNAFFSTVFNFLDAIITFFNLLQPLNAFFLMVVSFVEEIVIFVNDLQPSNELEPMVFSALPF